MDAELRGIHAIIGSVTHQVSTAYLSLDYRGIAMCVHRIVPPPPPDGPGQSISHYAHLPPPPPDGTGQSISNYAHLPAPLPDGPGQSISPRTFHVCVQHCMAPCESFNQSVATFARLCASCVCMIHTK